MHESANPHNPYQAPVDLPTPEKRWHARLGASRQYTLIAWIVVFLLNLPVALMFGKNAVEGSATLGMAAAVFVLLTGGCLTCIWLPRFMRTLVIGSVFTALSQVLPILHLMAGLLAFEVVHSLGFLSEPQDSELMKTDSMAGGLMMTGLTAGGVMVAALVIGFIVQLIGRIFLSRNAGSASQGH